MVAILRYAGFANEASFNEDPAPAAAFYVDKASSSLDVPEDTNIVYGGGLGRGRRTHRPGFYAPDGNIVWGFDISTIVHALRWTLGGYVFTADTPDVGENTHDVFAVDDMLLPSFAARLGKDKLDSPDDTFFEHVFRGCVSSQLQVEVSDGFFLATMDVIAAQDESDTIKDLSTVVPLLPAGYPLSFPDVTFKPTGGADDVAVRSLSLAINNNSDAATGQRLGSRHPAEIRAGERTVQLQIGVRYHNMDYIERVWGADAAPSPDGPVESPAQIVLDAGDDGSATIDLPRALWTVANQQPSGRDEIEQSITAECFVDTVNIGGADRETEIHASVINAEADAST